MRMEEPRKGIRGEEMCYGWQTRWEREAIWWILEGLTLHLTIK